MLNAEHVVPLLFPRSRYSSSLFRVPRDRNMFFVGEDQSRSSPYLVVSQIEIFALGGERTSGYWSHRQCDAQIVSNLTVQRRLKLF